jgi:heat shock protein HslJ
VVGRLGLGSPAGDRIPTERHVQCHRSRGSAGCNSFGGTYRYDPSSGRIELSENVFMTEMACPGGRDEFESAFILALTKATDASLDDEGRLVLRGTGGQVLLVAAR